MADSAEVRISNPSMTLMMKFVWPLGWLGMMSYFSLLAFTGSPKLRWGPGVSPEWGKVILVVFLLMGVLFMYRVSRRLKMVWLTTDGLRVSNYLSEASILWPQVRRVLVHDTFGHRRTPLVELELSTRRPFGGRISFYPASEDLLGKLTGQAAAFHVNVELCRDE
ncbi:MAG TPA: hypothetical protein VH394_01545 [Thermoanaerobaculia bacterium]|jgi:hypothetical protein|nr:hypothetical protein [Thermoanaerobaculia bacterium]